MVDGFAGAELQRAALRGASADAAALAPGEGADAARIVLVEEDPGLLARIEGELARAGRRAHRTDDPGSCAPGEVVLVEAAFDAVLDRLLPAVDDAPALFRLAPLSARSLPWSALERVLARPAADLLLRLPADDFARVGRFAGPVADLPPHLRRTAGGCSALLDDPRHGWIAAWRAADGAGGADQALLAVAERLRERVGAAVPGVPPRVVAVGRVPLLALVRDHAVLLELNGALRDAGVAVEPSLPIAVPEPREDAAPDAPLDLFPLPPPPEPDPGPRAPDPAALAELLHARHAGDIVPLTALAASLADSGLATEDLHAALRQLKRTGRAAYRALNDDGAEVDFLVDPAPSNPRRHRAARTRPPAPPDLFDPPA